MSIHGASIDNLGAEAANELGRARQLHGAMRGPHEGYAVILEELDELWDEVRAKEPDYGRMRKEALQIAAMALRFVYDVCDSRRAAHEPKGEKPDAR